MTTPRKPHSRKRFPSLVSWGRRLQVLGGLLVLLSPFLPWAQVPLLGISLPVPGVFLQGLMLIPVALVVLGAVLAGLRHPWLPLAASAAACALAVHGGQTVMVRTPYWLKGLQLWLSDLNQVLAKVGARTIEVIPRGVAPVDFVGFGVTVGVVGGVVLGLGAVLETIGYSRTSRPLPALLGFPRCRGCGHRVAHAMRFCPGCGVRHSEGKECPACDGAMQPDDTFCPWCGHGCPADPDERRPVGVRD